MLQKCKFMTMAVIAIGFFVITINAYAATPIVTSARITAPNTVTITYSEPVNTTVGDYSVFTGALSGRNLTSLSGSGSNTITLTFDGSAFAPDATGGLSIFSTVTSVSDGSQVGSGPYTIADGQTPLLSSVSISSNLIGNTFARSGDTLTVTFSTNESIYSSPAVTIAGNTISASGSGTGPYSAGYTLTSADTPDIIPVTMRFNDIAGNQGSGSFTFGSGLGPRILSITSNANTSGALVVGDSIAFTLTLATAAPGAYVSGSYNGIPLSWTTNNDGLTYTATYTVSSGNANTYSPLQISSVTITDSSGNVSVPVSGYDVLKTINAQSFNIWQITAVPSITTTATPTYVFYSTQEGTITYAGDCSSANLSATVGNNYIVFNSLGDGLHSNCTITVRNAAGYTSNILSVPSFTVSASSVANINQSSSATELQNQIAQLQTQLATLQGAAAAAGGSSSILSYKFYDPLKFGSTGSDVIALQERLTAEDVYSGPITGYYGSLTQAAVKKYQEKYGIAIAGQAGYGNVGPLTRATLNK